MPKATGRPAFEPKDAQRQIVIALRACGVSPERIAAELKIDKRTLYKYFRDEMAEAQARILEQIGGNVVKAAMGNGQTFDKACAFFYLKTHGGPEWREVSRTELTGADGAPLPAFNGPIPRFTVKVVAPDGTETFISPEPGVGSDSTGALDELIPAAEP